MDDVKLCKDCRYFVREGIRAGNCESPQNALPFVPDFVNGTNPPRRPTWYGAQFAREDEGKGGCGKEARWFEPKAPT